MVGEADFLFPLDQTGLTRGNLSSHVAKMPRTTYRLTEAGRKAFSEYRPAMPRGLEEGGRP